MKCIFSDRAGTIIVCSVTVIFILTSCRSNPTQSSTPVSGSTHAFLLPMLLSETVPTGTIQVEPLSKPAATADPMHFVLPTPGEAPVSAWRPPLYPIPWALSPFDHFYFSRPLGADEVNWPVSDYRYGIAAGAQYTHTGIDIPADNNIPVLAAGPGTVVWAGWGLFTNEPGNEDDPLGKAVAIRHDFGFQDQPLYTVYAHMRNIYVMVGQRVETGDLLGRVGETGHATGPHLHFEVRVGANDNYTTRNPELWMVPPEGWGVLVARITDLYDEPLDNTSLSIESQETGQRWHLKTYRQSAVNSDPYYRENFVLSDLPAGKYMIQMAYGKYYYLIQCEIFPGRVTFIRFQGILGFSIKPPPQPSIEIAPAAP
jgi:murein DD-endopeptidase MepM/ murein hydrolase activator NlpD